MQSSSRDTITPFLSTFEDTNTFAPTRNQQSETFTQYSLHYYDQWKATIPGDSFPQPEKLFGMSTERHSRSRMRTKLRHTLEQTLFALINGRDYAGAARVLSLMYHRFKSYPEICVQLSLEILRRSYVQTEGYQDIKGLYRVALKTKQLDKVLLQKELFLFYVSQGELYDAYHLFKGEIQVYMEKNKHDSDSGSFQGHPDLLGNFGILCYWLLLIESPQLRDKLKVPSIEWSSKKEAKAFSAASDSMVKFETGAQDRSFYSNLSSFESWIDQHFKYICNVGPHILFQEARMALRRVLSILPDSAAYIEYYVQLLTINGEISTAADYLEDFYHRHHSDVHAIRMLVQFLQCHYLESTGSVQVHLLRSWLEADPTSIVPLRNLYGLIGTTENGLVSVWWTELLASIIDTCGTELYFQQNPTHALWIWKIFEEHLGALTADLSKASSLDSIRDSRDWWKSTFFNNFDLTLEHKTNKRWEWMLYKAATAQKMFGNEFFVHLSGELCEWITTEIKTSDSIFSERLLALLERLTINTEYTTNEIVGEHAVWGMNRHVKGKDHKVFTGSLINRRVIFPDETKRRAPRTNDEHEQQTPCLKKRKTDASSSHSLIINGIAPLPAYVAIIEESVYQKRDLHTLSSSHLKTLTRRRIKHFGNAHTLSICSRGMAIPLLRVPTLQEIKSVRSYFRFRLLQSMLACEKTILPIRCEQYINTWLHGNYTTFSMLNFHEETGLKEQIIKLQDEMRRCVPRPQTTMLLSNQFSVTTIKRKMLALKRLRRRILLSFATVTRQLAQEQFDCGKVWFINHVFNAAWVICVEKRQTNLISRQDLKNTIASSLCSAYLKIVHPYRIEYRSVLSEFHKAEKGYKPRGQRKRKFLVMDDAPDLLTIARDRCSQINPTLTLIEAFIWIHLYFQAYPHLASIHLLPPTRGLRNRGAANTAGKNRPRKQ